MKLLLKKTIWPMTLCLTLLRIFGFLVPGEYSKRQKILLQIYSIFWYIYINGIYIIIQAGDLFQVWGEVPLMVSTSFLLFTNVAFGMKAINVLVRREAVQTIIDDGERELAAVDGVEEICALKKCNKETSRHLCLFIFLTGLTVLGWAASAEKSSLPLRAWYPYDTSKSPVYEITYFHQPGGVYSWRKAFPNNIHNDWSCAVLIQRLPATLTVVGLPCGNQFVSALCICAALNVSMDTLVTSLIALCRCRLGLLSLSLTKLCSGSLVGDNHELRVREEIVLPRLKACVRRHQAVLKSANEIQRCFSEPILAQFTVSIVIICVTAYQLAVIYLASMHPITQELHNNPMNVVRIVGMIAYLLCMILQVFLYCYQGNQLLIESSEIAFAAYSCPWYLCSLRFRRALLILMVRSKRDTRLTAGGLTTLSLACFTSIVKASYTFFTVLQRIDDRQK